MKDKIIEEKAIGASIPNDNKLNKMYGSYTKNNIVEISNIEAFRNNINLYLNLEFCASQSYTAFAEIIVNCIDELNQAKMEEWGELIPLKVDMEYDSSTNTFICEDYGRGIPVDMVKSVISKQNVGGKIRSSEDTTGYTFSIGKYSIGLKAALAASKEFDCVVHREGKRVEVKFRDSIFESEEITDCDKNLHGTRMRMVVDPSIINSPLKVPPLSIFNDFLNMYSYTNPYVEFNLKYDGVKYRYYSEKGLLDFFNLYIAENKAKKIIPEISLEFTDPKGEFRLKSVMTICQDSHATRSFVNTMITKDNGVHVSSITSGISRALTQYMKDNNSIPAKYEKMNISGSTISKYICGIVLVDHKNADYGNQVKSVFTSEDVRSDFTSVAYNTFLTFALNNQNIMNELIKHVLKVGEADYLAKQVKDKMLGKNVKTGFDSTITTKLHDCYLDDPSICEIFLVEGDSASGTVKAARNALFQSVYALRGKLTNMLKKNDAALSEELKGLIAALGMGFGANKDVSKLKYNKVIICTDADSDGGHICSLLMSFFYKYYPEIIQQGKLYRSRPPLKRITIKKIDKYIDAIDDKSMELITLHTFLHNYDFCNNKTNKPISEGLASLYIRGLITYGKAMDNVVKRLSICPYLLESIIMNYKDVLNGDYKNIEKIGYKVIFKKENGSSYNFIKGLKHYFLRLKDIYFYENVYLRLRDILMNNVVLNDIALVSKDKSIKYTGGNYAIAKVIINTFDTSSKDIEIARNKGLGENEWYEIEETVTNPNTRTLIKIQMNDIEKAQSSLDLFMDDGPENIKSRKEYFARKSK